MPVAIRTLRQRGGSIGLRVSRLRSACSDGSVEMRDSLFVVLLHFLASDMSIDLRSLLLLMFTLHR